MRVQGGEVGWPEVCASSVLIFPNPLTTPLYAPPPLSVDCMEIQPLRHAQMFFFSFLFFKLKILDTNVAC